MTIKRILSFSFSLFLALGALTALPACDRNEGPMEEAGEEIDQNTEKLGEQIEDAGERIQDKAEDASR